LPDESTYFRDQAAHCLKLAAEVDDPAIRERLTTLAGEYARRAETPPPIGPRRKAGRASRP
jgi:hypothetical protein